MPRSAGLPKFSHTLLSPQASSGSRFENDFFCGQKEKVDFVRDDEDGKMLQGLF